MQKKFIRIVVDGVVKYRAYQKDHWYSRWIPIEFNIENTGEELTELSIAQLACVPQIHRYNYDHAIYDDLMQYYHEQDVERHKTPYQISRMHDDSNMIEVLCRSKEIGDLSDGYHTFNELYYYRMLYNALWVNGMTSKQKQKYNVYKSKKHSDGNDCFGGGWFVVSAEIPTGQVTNHYEMKYWDLFHCEEREAVDEWDGHTPQESAERMKEWIERTK